MQFVDERYPTLADREHRGLTGKSSGGYGAMTVPMRRPDVFGALASHAGGSRFDGSWDMYVERLAEADHMDWDLLGKPFEMNGYAVAYTPDPERPGRGVMPFEA